MRAHAALLLLVSGCSLYFPQSTPGDDSPLPDARVEYDAGRPWPWPPPPPPPPPPIDGGSATGDVARCEDGKIFVAPAIGNFPDAPGHGAGQQIGICAADCRSAAVTCMTPDCHEAAAAVCNAAPSFGATCALEGTSCDGTSTIECPETTQCGLEVTGSTCFCTAGEYHCKHETPSTTIQAAIVGKWRGTVTPTFAAPYPISLWIYPDGTYWADTPGPFDTAFYYGGDGPAPDRRITIQSTSPTAGSWADITIDFSLFTNAGTAVPPNHGTLSGLTVNATTLRFTYLASWLDCGHPFDVTLTHDK